LWALEYSRFIKYYYIQLEKQTLVLSSTTPVNFNQLLFFFTNSLVKKKTHEVSMFIFLNKLVERVALPVLASKQLAFLLLCTMRKTHHKIYPNHTFKKILNSKCRILTNDFS
jgi:hypothetical protein